MRIGLVQISRTIHKAKAYDRKSHKLIVKVVIANRKGKRLRRMLAQSHDLWEDARLQEVHEFFKIHHNVLPM